MATTWIICVGPHGTDMEFCGIRFSVSRTVICCVFVGKVCSVVFTCNLYIHMYVQCVCMLSRINDSKIVLKFNVRSKHGATLLPQPAGTSLV